MQYDPNSTDALFSRILQRMDQQDVVLLRIEQGQLSTNLKVGKLEGWRTELRAKVAIMAGLISFAVAAIVQWWVNRSTGNGQ
jgi:hypothetical protein